MSLTMSCSVLFTTMTWPFFGLSVPYWVSSTPQGLHPAWAVSLYTLRPPHHKVSCTFPIRCSPSFLIFSPSDLFISFHSPPPMRGVSSFCLWSLVGVDGWVRSLLFCPDGWFFFPWLYSLLFLLPPLGISFSTYPSRSTWHQWFPRGRGLFFAIPFSHNWTSYTFPVFPTCVSTVFFSLYFLS